MKKRKYCCDAEIGTYGYWHSCQRAATARILMKGGGYLHYCKKHYNHASNPMYMTPATFANLELDVKEI